MNTFPTVGNSKSQDPCHRGSKQEKGLVKKQGHEGPNLRDLKQGLKIFFPSVTHREVSELYKERSGGLEGAENKP